MLPNDVEAVKIWLVVQGYIAHKKQPPHLLVSELHGALQSFTKSSSEELFRASRRALQSFTELFRASRRALHEELFRASRSSSELHEELFTKSSSELHEELH